MVPCRALDHCGPWKFRHSTLTILEGDGDRDGDRDGVLEGDGDRDEDRDGVLEGDGDRDEDRDGVLEGDGDRDEDRDGVLEGEDGGVWYVFRWAPFTLKITSSGLLHDSSL